MSAVTLHEGDNRDHLRRLIDQGVRVHSVVTDPPYGLTSVVKRFGKEGAAPAKHGTDGAFARASGGFMGKAWDGTGIERDPEFWRLIWEILLPGGFVFAFSGSRTGHWQACAMETAGFIMHPMHGWVYGSGFPKASNAERAVDAKICDRPGRHYEVNLPENPRPDDHVCGSSAEGDAWAGWSYGTQAQKPALEPIYLGQKPFSEKTGAANLLKHGVGAVNIDGCRVPFADEADEQESKNKNRHADFGSGPMTNEVYGKYTQDRGNYDPPGRWPANLLHDAGADVVELFPDGSARFFSSFPEGPDADAIIYQAKATKADRAGSKHPTVKPVALMQHLIRHITPPGGVVLDPFAGSGTTAEAARREGFDCILMEQDPGYAAFLRERFDLAEDSYDDAVDYPMSQFDADLAELLGCPISANDDLFPDDDIKSLLG